MAKQSRFLRKNETQPEPQAQAGEHPEILDPQQVAITYVDSILAVSPGPVTNLVLGAWHQDPVGGGAVETQYVIGARLRFDTRFATQLRDALNQIIEAAGE